MLGYVQLSLQWYLYSSGSSSNHNKVKIKQRYGWRGGNVGHVSLTGVDGTVGAGGASVSLREEERKRERKYSRAEETLFEKSQFPT